MAKKQRTFANRRSAWLLLVGLPLLAVLIGATGVIVMRAHPGWADAENIGRALGLLFAGLVVATLNATRLRGGRVKIDDPSN